MDAMPGPPAWSPMKRLLFRFGCAYWSLYLGPFAPLWDALVPWVARNVFRVTATLPAPGNGSGDTTYHYVQAFCVLTLAVLAAAVWTLCDRRRSDYRRLDDWLRVLLRFQLASVMLSYSAIKVFPSQFPSPPLERLLQPMGELSPMVLMWTFMGVSVSYNVFCGVVEMLGGLLLTARRTTVLGALVCIGVLTNVLMLNLCYDVPVKLFSAHLLAMALFLAAPQARRLAGVFVWNIGVGPTELRPLFQRPWRHRVALVLRSVLVTFLVVSSLSSAYETRKSYRARRLGTPLYGIWDVEDFLVDGKLRPPLLGDAGRWRWILFDYADTINIHAMDCSHRRYHLTLDTEAKTLTLTKKDDAAWTAVLDYEDPDADHLMLRGSLEGRAIRAHLRRTDESHLLLVNRGFHWINETPFGR